MVRRLAKDILAVPTSSVSVERQRNLLQRIRGYVTHVAARLGLTAQDASLWGLLLVLVFLSVRRLRAPSRQQLEPGLDMMPRKPKPKLPAGLDCELDRQLGDGAFAVVWLASQKGEQRAIKFIHTDVQKEEDHLGRDVAEVECGKRLQGCELVVQLLDVFHETGVHTLVLEYLPGGELFEHMCKLHYYTEDCARRCFRRIVLGVNDMHLRGVVHRDLKPENLLLAHRVDKAHPVSEVPVKIADLGLAYLEENPWAEKSLLGTPGFLAPEMARHELHTRACDVFSLGSILFNMLTGDLPWEEKIIDSLQYRNHSDNDFLALPELQLDTWTHLSADVQSLVLRMLRQNPKERPTTTDILSDTWLQVSDDSPRHLKSQGRLSKQMARKRMKKVTCAARAIGRMATLAKTPKSKAHQ